MVVIAILAVARWIQLRRKQRTEQQPVDSHQRERDASALDRLGNRGARPGDLDGVTPLWGRTRAAAHRASGHRTRSQTRNTAVIAPGTTRNRHDRTLVPIATVEGPT